MTQDSTMTMLDFAIETLHDNRKHILISLQRASSCKDEWQSQYREYYLILAARGMILHADILANIATL